MQWEPKLKTCFSLVNCIDQLLIKSTQFYCHFTLYQYQTTNQQIFLFNQYSLFLCYFTLARQLPASILHVASIHSCLPLQSLALPLSPNTVFSSSGCWAQCLASFRLWVATYGNTGGMLIQYSICLLFPWDVMLFLAFRCRNYRDIFVKSQVYEL